MHDVADAFAHAGLGNGARALALHRVEALLAARHQDADEVDHRIRALDRPRDRLRIAEIGLDGVDLAHDAKRLEMARELGARTATRTRQPRFRSARTTWRPTKPEPPNTVTSRSCAAIIVPNRSESSPDPQVARLW